METEKIGFTAYLILSCILFISVLASPLTSIGEKLIASIIMFNLIALGFMLVHLRNLVVKK